MKKSHEFFDEKMIEEHLEGINDIRNYITQVSNGIFEVEDPMVFRHMLALYNLEFDFKQLIEKS